MLSWRSYLLLVIVMKPLIPVWDSKTAWCLAFGWKTRAPPFIFSGNIPFWTVSFSDSHHAHMRQPPTPCGCLNSERFEPKVASKEAGDVLTFSRWLRCMGDIGWLPTFWATGGSMVPRSFQTEVCYISCRHDGRPKLMISDQAPLQKKS